MTDEIHKIESVRDPADIFPETGHLTRSSYEQDRKTGCKISLHLSENVIYAALDIFRTLEFRQFVLGDRPDMPYVKTVGAASVNRPAQSHDMR